jgi:hypothetical protein
LNKFIILSGGMKIHHGQFLPRRGGQVELNGIHPNGGNSVEILRRRRFPPRRAAGTGPLISNVRFGKRRV